MQAEYISCFEASQQASFLRNLITGMQVVECIRRPIVIFCDNKAAVFFSKNNKKSYAARLMDVKYQSVKEKVKAGIVSIEHINTSEMLADSLTKPLGVGVFKDHVTCMGVVESFDAYVMRE